MPLDQLVGGIVDAPASCPTVTGITLDSRAVRPGWLYVALPGTKTHGATFAQQAVAAGAVAVLTDDEGAALAAQVGVPVLVAVDLRLAMGMVAARLFGYPAKAMTTIGLTGTNGKTTTAFLLAAALGTKGVATIGTIGFRLGEAELDATRTTVTTPESPDLQALLAWLVEHGATAAAIEVSSHAMVLHRAAGIRFDYAGFVNLGHDHLDFHRTHEAYFEAKASLFAAEACEVAVINIGDPAGRRIAERVAQVGAPKLVTIGAPDADYWLSEVRQTDPLHLAATLHAPSGVHSLALAMPGTYNATNALLAFAIAEQSGATASSALAGLARASVPGRMQPVELGPGAPLVVVDFAHTPQAVEAALATFDPWRDQRRIIAVLGAGGDRDTDKRPLMGAAAARHADTVIITDDNPRTEDPGAIRAAVLAGTTGHPDAHEVSGRAAGIRAGLALARPGDVVAILGKGHEVGQIIGSQVVEFDDVTVAREQWAAVREESI